MRPEPSQTSHGVSGTLPEPWQTSQVTARTIWPNGVRVTWRSWPAPPQRSQVSIGVPGSAPLPWQCEQTTTAVVGDLALDPGRDLVEGQLGLEQDVAAGRRAAAAAEAAAPPNAWPKRDWKRSSIEPKPGAGVEAAGAQALGPVLVVGAAPLGVGEDLVGLGRLLEARFGLGVVAGDVGVQFAGEAAEGFLDFGVRGVTGDAQNLVVIAWHVW